MRIRKTLCDEGKRKPVNSRHHRGRSLGALGRRQGEFRIRRGSISRVELNHVIRIAGTGGLREPSQRVRYKPMPMTVATVTVMQHQCQARFPGTHLNLVMLIE